MPELPAVEPRDEANRTLLENVHPSGWINPQPRGRFNLVVVGGGTAGLITSAIAAGLGAKVALCERHLLGGDCLNVGCVPSKGVIRASRFVAEARRAEKEVGLALAAGAQPEFAAAMQRMRRIRARISHDDSALRYRDTLGVEVFLGEARFTGRDRVEIDGRELRFARAVIATGARAAAPPIEGLAEAGYLTNETVFNLTARPPRLGVIGAGPIGCELAQAFRRLGSEVVIVHADPHLLPREDADAAAILERRFAEEGIRVVHGATLRRVLRQGGAKLLRFARAGGAEEEALVDEILVGVGRAPNVEGLGLEAAGVAYDARRGVHVDDFLRTSNARIFAAGDICMDWKFTHAADAAAKIAVQNALFTLGPFGRKKLSALVMPWCTYTDPEIAHVGLYARDAAAAGIEVDTLEVPLSEVNRAVLDGEEEGFVKVHVRKGTDRIVGATVVAAHAGEIISELTLAIVGGLGLGTLGNVIHPYPTQAEGIKRVAGVYTRSRLTPRIKRWFERYLALRR
jgi:pyruvate/2-oxoglutarate dehydrogenase complex dihydrolipoamide dehydrogenase (E3) component